MHSPMHRIAYIALSGCVRMFEPMKNMAFSFDLACFLVIAKALYTSWPCVSSGKAPGRLADVVILHVDPVSHVPHPATQR